MTAGERFEAHAAAWIASGKPAGMLYEGERLMVLRCWSWSTGGKAEDQSGTLKAFIKASEAACHPDWLDNLLDDRGTCRDCGERFRLENLMACTDCLETHCHACGGAAPRAPNGNHACRCGGELVG